MEEYTNQSSDGLKELNRATEEYYDEKRETYQVDEEEVKPKKTLYDYIRIGLLLISYLIFAFSNSMKYGFELMAIAIFLFTLGTFFLEPIQRFITEGEDCRLLFRASFFLRILLFLFFFMSLAIIFVTTKQDLNYSYWIAIISFLSIATIHYIESSIWDFRRRKNWSRIAKILRLFLDSIILFVGTNLIYLIIQMSFPDERSPLIVNQLRAPDRVEILVLDEEVSGNEEAQLNNIISITDQALIQQIKTELENQVYDPMDIISELNFIKRKNTSQVYQLSLYYSKYDPNNIFAYPFSIITFYEDQFVYRYTSYQNEFWISRNTLNNYYYLRFSDETRNKLYSYISNGK